MATLYTAKGTRAIACLLVACLLFCLVACTAPVEPTSPPEPQNRPTTEEPQPPQQPSATRPALTEPVVTSMDGDYGIDFLIEFPQGNDLTVLQITDTQIQLLAGARNETRYQQIKGAFFYHDLHDPNIRLWRYMDEAVERADPDLIVLTGDSVYGELDDDGTLWTSLCQRVDSYGVPWMIIFGNHDNESAKGVNWQIEQLEQCKHCVFARGNVTGNSNYTVLITQGEEYRYLFYLLDTNGCSLKPHNPGEGLMPDNPDIDQITSTPGIHGDQVQWIRESSEQIFQILGPLPVFIFCHIPPFEARIAASELYPDAYVTFPFTPDQNGDSGCATEPHGGFQLGNSFFETAREIGCVGMFVGHQHKIATSMLYKGIRITYGLKTGSYDYHDSSMLGATKIILRKDRSFSVEYLYSELEYLG